MRFWRRLRGDQRGFGLVELMVAVSIMGMTAHVPAAVKMLQYVERAELTAVQSAARQIHQAMEMYAVYNGGYPAALADYAGLRGALGAYATFPAEANAPFTLVSYQSDGAGYTLVVRGKDAAGTVLTITPAGVR